MKLSPLSQGQLGDRFLILLFQGGDIRWGRRHFLAQHLLQHPNAAFDRTGTVGKGGRRQNTGHSEDSASIGIRQLHAAHPRPGDGVFQPIDGSEGSVEERVIRIHEPHDAPVFAHDAFEKQACLLVHCQTHLGVHLRKLRSVKRLAFQARQPQPLRAKTVEQSPRPRVFEQAPHLRPENGRFMKFPAIGQRGQFGVGHGGPQQIRQSRRQLMIIQAHNPTNGLPLTMRGDEEELR